MSIRRTLSLPDDLKVEMDRTIAKFCGRLGVRLTTAEAVYWMVDLLDGHTEDLAQHISTYAAARQISVEEFARRPKEHR